MAQQVNERRTSEDGEQHKEKRAAAVRHESAGGGYVKSLQVDCKKKVSEKNKAISGGS